MWRGRGASGAQESLRSVGQAERSGAGRAGGGPRGSYRPAGPAPPPTPRCSAPGLPQPSGRPAANRRLRPRSSTARPGTQRGGGEGAGRSAPVWPIDPATTTARPGLGRAGSPLALRTQVPQSPRWPGIEAGPRPLPSHLHPQSPGLATPTPSTAQASLRRPSVWPVFPRINQLYSREPCHGYQIEE